MMNEHADHIASGACKNFDEYQKMTGVIEGLALAERELLDYVERVLTCLLYTSPSPRDGLLSRMPSSA